MVTLSQTAGAARRCARGIGRVRRQPATALDRAAPESARWSGLSTGNAAPHRVWLHAHRRRVQGLEKIPQRAGNALRLLPVEEVTTVREADQLAVLQPAGDGGPL